MRHESNAPKPANVRSGKLFLDVLDGFDAERAPFWFMRQAGRYLPEYRELRASKGGFLAMAMDPQTACEITMQPLRRFGMDAAIIFSDILVVPQALGQKLEFAEGEGPKLEPVRNASDLAALGTGAFGKNLAPVYAAIEATRAKMKTEGFAQTALIGFAGAPWTVAAYMIEGSGSKDFHHAKKMALSEPKLFSELISLLVESTAGYLCKQVEAGAEVLQIFDSWAGLLDDTMFREWVINPTREVISLVRDVHPYVPIIGFPRGAGANYLSYAQDTGVTALGLDYQVPTRWAAQVLQPMIPVQGNLDPAALLAGGAAMTAAAEKILHDLGRVPFIFNLGHGVHKDTPPEHMAALCTMLKNWRAP
ncbi:MAG: uroporphyrinogen decarboxylase [Alphaproteobacteria bacterium]